MIIQLNFSLALLPVRTGFVFHEPQRAQRAQRGDEKRINEREKGRFIAIADFGIKSLGVCFGENSKSRDFPRLYFKSSSFGQLLRQIGRSF